MGRIKVEAMKFHALAEPVRVETMKSSTSEKVQFHAGFRKAVDMFPRTNGLRVHFKVLQSALIDQPKVPKGLNEPLGEPKEDLLIDKIILLLRDNPKATYDDLVTELSVSRSTIKRAMGNLVADGHIVRVGGKRYGHWVIND